MEAKLADTEENCEQLAAQLQQVLLKVSWELQAKTREEMGKRRDDKEIWQREKEEMQRQVNRLRAEVLAAENDKASLEEMNYRSEEYKGVWQSEREEMKQQVNRLREGVLTAKNAKTAAELQAQKVWIKVHVSALKN
jgi:hypothetical protein